ncbi:MFS transporter [Actinomadura logoneensis]|uniref:MFS transporter n=1 Tax=Actinomadura logoneensis TaxID=2293572 RepID=A0A372JFC5_9ACTN|nr:MFS transporter [Actinomadura logoneensis]RFU38599.1 MFS transporter [Actinomadura logoneensis]
MSSPYRALLAVPGAKAFVTAGFVGRMAMSMVSIGIVLLVSAVTGSYGIAGSVSATLSVAYALGAPVSARYADRLGQRRVLVPLVSVNTAAFALLIGLAVFEAPLWTLYPASALAGCTQVSLGAWVRSRWSHALRDTSIPMGTAYSFESVMDELIFVAGPILVTSLATGVHPAAGIAVAVSCTLVGGLAFARLRRTEPPPRPRAPGASGKAGVFANPAVRILSLIFLLTGAVFGAIDVSGVAFAAEQGHKPLAGVLLACYAGGSATSAFWYGARNWRAPVDRRFLVGSVLLAVLLAPTLLVGDFWPMLPVVFVAGLAISPTIIPGFGLVEELVPDGQLTEGLALVSTTISIGAAAGASLAGRVADAYGAEASFGVPLASAVVAALVTLAAYRAVSKRELSSRTIPQ